MINYNISRLLKLRNVSVSKICEDGTSVDNVSTSDNKVIENANDNKKNTSNKLTIIGNYCIQKKNKSEVCKHCSLQYCNGERHITTSFISPTCKWCGIELNDIIELLGNRLLRNKFICEICGKKYATDENKDIHFLSHFYRSRLEYESKFSCLQCKKSKRYKFNECTNISNDVKIETLPMANNEILSQLPVIDRCIENEINAQDPLDNVTDNEIEISKSDEMIKVKDEENILCEEIIYKCIQCSAECMTQNELNEHEFMDHDGPPGYNETVDIFSSKFDQKFPLFDSDYYIDEIKQTDSDFDNINLSNHANDQIVNEFYGNITYNCEFCHEVFLSIKEVKHHYKTIHPGANFFYAKCRLCNKEFLSKSFRQLHELENHMNPITKKYDCKDCSRMFDNPSSLILHQVSHMDKINDICEICGKGFKRSKNLMEHMSIHTGERPYKCDICQQTYSKQGGLKYHMTGHSGATPYKCKYCTKQFRDSSDLRRHTRIHVEVEKRFVCLICRKSFYERKHLTYHMKRHSNAINSEKPKKNQKLNDRKSFKYN